MHINTQQQLNQLCNSPVQLQLICIILTHSFDTIDSTLKGDDTNHFAGKLSRSHTQLKRNPSIRHMRVKLSVIITITKKQLICSNKCVVVCNVDVAELPNELVAYIFCFFLDNFQDMVTVSRVWSFVQLSRFEHRSPGLTMMISIKKTLYVSRFAGSGTK